MTIKEHLVKELDGLDEKQLLEVEEFVLFLRFRSRFLPSQVFDEEQMAKLYGEFAEEDRLLAEEGIQDYATDLSSDYQRLEKAAKRAGKSVQLLVHEWITHLPEVEEPFDVTSDPVYLMEGYESDAPADLSVNLDQYLYGEDHPK